MRRSTLSTLAAAGSAALLAGALGFQHLGGYAPCELCLIQRWPHVVAVAMGIVALLLPPRMLWRFAGLAAALTASALGLYHTGVERGWWEGPTACSGQGSIADLSPDQLLNQIMAAPVVRCTDVAWHFLGLSMASWNAILSLGLAILWAASISAPRQKANGLRFDRAAR